ncbi:hypothetical protein FACS189428_5420 [Clostridia bacterium]|nr:hypothetical protein FACS189428_5420 [Clostridia bacterium]
MLGENNPSHVYVQNKKKYAESLGIVCHIIDENSIDLPYSIEHLKQTVHQLNTDPDCIGIIVQLPLSEALQPYRDEICATVHPLKDIDGLGGIVNGWNQL